MNPNELLKLLKHIIVWIPESNPIRKEIPGIIDQLRNNLRQQQ
jgi:hypothetical protein